MRTEAHTRFMESFEIDVPESALDDLCARLERVRLPADPENHDWRYGTERGALESLVAYWQIGRAHV